MKENMALFGQNHLIKWERNIKFLLDAEALSCKIYVSRIVFLEGRRNLALMSATIHCCYGKQ